LKNLKKGDNLEGTGADGRIILKFVLKKEGMKWIDLAEDRDKWQALVNKVVNLQMA
jgi:hypothetical protein